jgi:DNA primase
MRRLQCAGESSSITSVSRDKKMALIPDSFLKDLTDKVDIVSVIERSVKLTKTGGGGYVGLCPFHSEKSPSFTVRPSHGTFRCFGCGESGGAITFLVKHDGMGFRDAVEHLAKEVNMEMPKDSPADVEASRHQEKLHAVLQRAQDLYASQLLKEPKMLAYLEERGITREMIARFGIGAAPNKSDFLRANMKDVPADVLKSAGLLAEKERDGRTSVYEPMRDRIVFPIRGASGKVISFGGRTIHPGVEPKYKNGAETEVFKKTNELYGFYEAAAEIRKKGVAIVGEGYVDVVIPSGHGVGNIVAPMGTALSKSTIARLFRNAKTIIFCFDGDRAGVNAAVRAMENCAPMLKAGNTVRFAFLPDGSDPDEFVRTYGADAFNQFLAKADPLSKFMITHYSSKNDMSSAEGRAQFASEALALVNQIVDPILKAVLEDEVKLAARIGTADASYPSPIAGPALGDLGVPMPSVDSQEETLAAGGLTNAGASTHPASEVVEGVDSGDDLPAYLRDDPGPQFADFAFQDVDGFGEDVASLRAEGPASLDQEQVVGVPGLGSEKVVLEAAQNVPGRRPRQGFGVARAVPGVEVRERRPSAAEGAPSAAVPMAPANAADTPAPHRRRGSGFAAERAVQQSTQNPPARNEPGAHRRLNRPEAPTPSASGRDVVQESAGVQSSHVTEPHGEQLAVAVVPASHRRRGFAFVAEQQAATLAAPGRNPAANSGDQGGSAATSNGIASRLSAIFVAQPIYAGFVEPEWVASTVVPEDEKDAIRHMLSTVREYNVSANRDGDNPITRELFLAGVTRGPAAPFVQAAIASGSTMSGDELESEFTELVEQLARGSELANASRYKP